MPVGPRYRSGDSQSRVPRQFTDREQFIEAFEEAVSEFPLEEYRVLVYYGVGGIGKTRLRKELARLLDEQHPQTVWAVLDFRTPAHRDVETALFWLRQELSRKYKIQFPSFDLAYALSWQKSHPQVPLREDPSRLRALIEQEGSLFASLLSAAGVPLVSVLPQVSKYISRTNRLLREWWTKRGHRELNELQEMAPSDIAARLPMFWGADLKDFMERESRPVVLFIDTYEALWEDRRTEGRFFSQDEWVRELVAQLPGVLWVIAGRERLRWEELEPDWRNYQRQHLVGGLEESDARRFLTTCGITEEALQRIIVEGGKGVPFYLDLAVDTYLEIKDVQHRDPAPSDFGRTPQEVLNRFRHYLDRSEEETLKVLSVARFWDRTLFELLVEEFNTGYPLTALPELRRFSFIQGGQVPDTWTIHPLMRDGLEEQQDPELRGRVHRYLFDHYNLLLQELENTAITDLHKTALIEAFHHGKHVLATEELFEWFTTIAEIFKRAALWPLLDAEHDTLRAALQWALDNDRIEEGLQLAVALGGFWSWRGHTSEGRLWFSRLIQRGQEVPPALRADAFDEAGRLAWAQGDYTTAENNYRDSLELRQQLNDVPAMAASYQLLGNVSHARRHVDAARDSYTKSLDLYSQVGDDAGRAGAYHILGELARNQGDSSTARAHYEESLKIWRRIDNQHRVVETLNRLGEVSLAQQQYEAAEKRFIEGLEIARQLQDTGAIAASHLGLAGFAMARDDYAAAREHFEQSLALYEESNNPQGQIFAHGGLAVVARFQGDYPRARAHCRQHLKLDRKIGDTHGLAWGLEELATIEAAASPALAARLLGAAERIRAEHGIPRQYADDGDFTETVAQVRSTLGEEAFTAARAAGEVLTDEQVLAEVLAEPDPGPSDSPV